ncbi:MAG TPA: hypothetical protein VGN64_03510, partial [Dyadobacter sp.]|nr:hypothetical protein [Dyadobacter sp.]
NTKNIFAAALMAMTVVTFANANSVDEKIKNVVAVNTLPANVPAIETPAPQVAKNTIEINKYNAGQKAAIVELNLKGNTTK